jgi:hypothetical protein
MTQLHHGDEDGHEGNNDSDEGCDRLDSPRNEVSGSLNRNHPYGGATTLPFS